MVWVILLFTADTKKRYKVLLALLPLTGLWLVLIFTTPKCYPGSGTRNSK